MLAELAAGLVLPSFAATPPHFAAPVRLVHATRPVEVFFFDVFIRTVFTSFHTLREIAFSGHKLRNSLLKLFPLLAQLFNFFVLSLPLVDVASDLLDCSLQVSFQVSCLLLGLQ